MKDDPETNDAWSDDSTYSPKQRRIGSSSNKLLFVLLGILIVLIFAGGILYFLSTRTTGGEASPLQSRVTALEQKIAGLEKQLVELQGKIDTSGPDPALLQRVDALAQKIEALGKQKQLTAESKAKPSAPSKSAVLTEKKIPHSSERRNSLPDQ
jgi:cell division protein FtsL